MEKKLQLKVAADYIEKIAAVNGIKAICELIWNSLDADALNVEIVPFQNKLGIYAIEIRDNGVGMTYTEAEKAFSMLGGSLKIEKKVSEQSRLLHGSAGQGRLKVFSLGDLVEYRSNFIADSIHRKSFTMLLDRNNLSQVKLSELQDGFSFEHQGVSVYIQNVHAKNVNQIFSEKGMQEIEEHFSFYYSKYPNFKISIDGKNLDFEQSIAHQKEETFKFQINYEDTNDFEELDFTFKLTEWNKNQSKKIFLCGDKGITFQESKLRADTHNYPITVHITSTYIDKLKKVNLLELQEMDNVLQDALELSNQMVQDYVAKRMQEDEKVYIQTLKDEGTYPYIGTPKSKSEQEIRSKFNTFLIQYQSQFPKINGLDIFTKKSIFELLKFRVENDIQYNINNGNEKN